ncbi:MAG: long-chain fatty acid--CoA ligase [Bacteroides sp.]|nr:long-chain fatty acid--CoA ligase [Bacteroides sp.]MCM1380175.1 long-chain fatty acid--CoA ligase [Bacteroides sp.]MCM1446476.1 long-chain fatty acid--CoA ligase [Prevotella sp.]
MNYLVEIPHKFKNTDKPALHRLMDPETGTWTPISCGEFRATVLDLGAALIDIGLGSQETVGLLSANNPEYIAMSFAAWQVRGVTVGIYATSTPEQVKYLVDDAKIRVMLVGSQQHYDIARSLGVEHIIAVDSDIVPADGDTTTIRYHKFLEAGRNASEETRKEVERRAKQVNGNDLATLLYTSGTTGQSKGAMLTHHCFNTAMNIHERRLTMLSDADSSLTFLPLTHVFELAWTCFCLHMNMEIFVNSDPKRAQRSLRETTPTCMCAVPRFWEKVYAVIQEKLAAMGFVSKAMMNRALNVGIKRNLQYARRGIPAPAMLEREYQMYNNRVFRKVRKVIGVDRGNIFPTAGAPLSPQIIEFLHAIGINIVIGYGLSETTATVTCYPALNFEIGSVGTILPELRMRIGDGNEIQVKGATVMTGYFNNPEATAEAFTADGWFRTGDAGRIDAGGNLFLTERIKDLFKTSNGKYIAPQALESRLGKDGLFEQVAIIGDRRKFVSALIVPDYDALRTWAENHRLGHLSNKELAENPRVIEHVQERIEELTKDLAPYEHIRRFALLTEPFTMENGELTNTLKIRRRVVADRYASLIDSLYAES